MVASGSKSEWFVAGHAVERAVWDSDLGGVYLARAPLADSCAHVVKIRVRGVGEGEGAFARACDRLIGSAREQQVAAHRAPGVWASVLEFGATDSGGAFVLRERCALSLAELLDLRPRVGAEAMASIVGPVLRALVVLRDACDGRAHGALTPANILLDPPAAGRQWRTVLTDPLPRDLLGADSAEGDLRAVGRLIRQLATGRAGAGGDWSSLGRAGVAWRELAEHLAPGDASPETTLDAALRRVEGFVQRRHNAKRLAIGGTVGAGVVLIAGAGSAWYMLKGDAGMARGGATRAPFEPDSFRRWCADADSWLLYFEREAPANRGVLSQDPHLASTVLGVLDEARSREIELDPKEFVKASPRSRLRLIDVLAEDEKNRRLGGRVTEAMDIVGRLRAGLNRWGAADRATQRVALYRDRGWTPQANTLARLVGSVHPQDWVDAQTGAVVIPDQVDTEFGARMVESMLNLIEADRIGERVEEAWARIAENTAIIDAASKGAGADPADPVLARFSELPGAYITFSGVGGRMDTLERLDERVARVDALAAGLAEFCASGWTSIDREFHAARSGVLGSHKPDGQLTTELFESWLAEVSAGGYTKLTPDSDPRLAYGGRSGFERLDERLGSLRHTYGDQLVASNVGEGDLQGRIDSLFQQAAALDQIEWRRLTQDQVEAGAGELAGAHAEVSAALDSAAARMETIAQNLVTELRGRDGVTRNGVSSIDAAWRESRDALLTAYESDARYITLLERSTEAGEFLARVERELTPSIAFSNAPRQFDPGPIGPVVAYRVDERAGRVIEAGAWDGSAFDPIEAGLRLDTLAVEQASWATMVESVLLAHAGVERMLDLAFTLSEVNEDAESIDTLLDSVAEAVARLEPGVTESVAGVRSRVDELRSLELVTDPDELARLASDADESRSAYRVTAYMRLDSVGADWMTDEAALSADQRAHAAATGAARAIPDDARRTLVLDRVLEAGRARWARYADAARDTAALDNAARAREEYGADEASVSARARYNLRRRQLETTDLAAGEDAVRAQVVAVRDALSPIASALAPEARTFYDELVDIALPPSDDRPVLDAQDFGPGVHGWDGYDVEGGERLIYSWPSRDAPELRIEFVRIEPGSDNGLARAAYVAAQETSLGIVMRASDSLLASQEFLESWANLDDAKRRAGTAGGQEWSGPRAWTWRLGRNARESDSLGVGESWLRRHAQMVLPDQPAYAPGLGDPASAQLVAPGQGRPSPESPAQDISPAAAELVAAALGARLPNEQEWLAAFEGGVGVVDENAWNLRDATFARQRDWVRSLDAKLLAAGQTSQFQYPDRDAFVPDDFNGGQGADASARPSDDGVLWFEPVGSGRGGAFENLVGNVAEFVTTGDGFGVVGGSALSPPELAPTSVSPIKNYRRRRSYTDVGFRMALDVPDGVFRQTVNRRVEKLLARTGYWFE